VGIYDKAGEFDSGHHVFTGLNIHIDGDVQVPDVNFTRVELTCDQETPCVLNSSRLEIDYHSMARRNREKVIIFPPWRGIVLHTTNILTFVNITILSAKRVRVNGMVISAWNFTANRIHWPEITINTRGNVNLVLSSLIRNSASIENVPKLRIVVEGDTNSVSCSGEQWPLSDLTAKIIIDHGAHPLHINGELEGKDFVTKPPVLAHFGSGPLFFNNILSNFHNQYCVCQGTGCDTQCASMGHPIPFDEHAIHKSIHGNPNRVVEYYLYGTNHGTRPYFGLHDFRNKSFLVSALEGRQYLTLEGASDLFVSPPSSVSHTFQNVNLLLDNPGYYLFNNAVFINVTISKNARDKSLYHIVQRGMTIDFTSLYRFFESNLFFPCSLYMLIDGGQASRRSSFRGRTRSTSWENSEQGK
jgi:hypothetical protein